MAIVRVNGLTGAVNIRGQIVVPLKFADIQPYGQNGLAAASLDVHPLTLAGQSGHWGFIDRSGNFVIRPIYTSVTRFEDKQFRKDLAYAAFRAPLDLAAAQSTDASGVETTTYIDKEGKFVIRLPKGLLGLHVNRNGIISVFDGRKPNDISFGHRYAFFDPEKPSVPTVWYDSVGEFRYEDLAPVSSSLPTWGYINRSGAEVIEPHFENALPFEASGLAPVQAKDPTSGRYSAALIDKNGKVQLRTPFDAIMPFQDSEFALVVVERRSAFEPIALPADECAIRTP